MNCVLIVIDLIEDYFDASIWPTSFIPSKRADLIASTNELVDVCRRHHIPVVWVRQEFSPDFSDAFPHAIAAEMRYAIRGTPGGALLQELDVRSEDEVLAKKRFSAFHQTGLLDSLTAHQTDVIVLAGITTAWCIRSTATDAYQLDYDVVLASDCMAAFDDTAHYESLAAMDGYIGRAQTNAEIRDMLEGRTQA